MTRRRATGSKMWLTLLGPDLGEVDRLHVGLNAAPQPRARVHDAAEQRRPTRTRSPARTRPAENIQHMDAIVGVFGALFGKFLVMLIPRDDYCHPFKHAASTSRRPCSSRQSLRIPVRDDGRPARGRRSRRSHRGRGSCGRWRPVARLGPGSVHSCRRCSSRASTRSSRGRSGARSTPTTRATPATGRTTPNGAEFAGYPPADSSPYRLPYPKGKSCYVGQANLGMWSHNLLTNNLRLRVRLQPRRGRRDRRVAAGHGRRLLRLGAERHRTRRRRPSRTASRGARQTDRAAAELHPDPPRRRRRRRTPIAPNDTHDMGPGGTVAVTYGVYLHGRDGQRARSVRGRSSGSTSTRSRRRTSSTRRRRSPSSAARRSCSRRHRHELPQPPAHGGPRREGPERGTGCAARGHDSTSRSRSCSRRCRASSTPTASRPTSTSTPRTTADVQPAQRAVRRRPSGRRRSRCAFGSGPRTRGHGRSRSSRSSSGAAPAVDAVHRGDRARRSRRRPSPSGTPAASRSATPGRARAGLLGHRRERAAAA